MLVKCKHGNLFRVESKKDIKDCDAIHSAPIDKRRDYDFANKFRRTRWINR